MILMDGVKVQADRAESKDLMAVLTEAARKALRISAHFFHSYLFIHSFLDSWS
jgi:hypothetical protein